MEHDTRGMQWMHVTRGQQCQGNRFKKVVPQVSLIFDCLAREPGRGKALAQVADSIIVGICHHRHQVLLPAEDWRWQRRSRLLAICHHDMEMESAPVEQALRPGRPACFSGLEDARGICGQPERKAQWKECLLQR